MTKKVLCAICAVAAMTAALPAFAAESNFYGVFSVGRSRLDVDPTAVDQYNLRNGFASSASSTSTSTTGAKAQLGYTLTDTFALEGGYTYLGKADFTSVTNLGVIGGNKEAHLFNLDLVARYALNQSYSIFGRVGGYYWKTKNDMASPLTLGTVEVNDNAWDVKFGAGVQYDFTPKFGLRGEFERFNGIGKQETTGDSKVNLFTIGAVLKF